MPQNIVQNIIERALAEKQNWDKNAHVDFWKKTKFTELNVNHSTFTVLSSLGFKS